MTKNKVKTTNKKIIYIAIAVSLLILGTTLYLYKNKQSEKAQFPQEYPYSCDYPTNIGTGPTGCGVIEDKGKVIVAQRPEVKQLVSKYGRKGVIITALAFSQIQDKAFLKSLLAEHYIELGCIIYVSYPGGQTVYLDDDRLDVIKQLDGQVFTQWLKTASQSDIDRFNKYLR